METNSRNIVGLFRAKVEGASSRNFRRTCDDRNWPARDPTLVFFTSYLETMVEVVNGCNGAERAIKCHEYPTAKPDVQKFTVQYC